MAIHRLHPATYDLATDVQIAGVNSVTAMDGNRIVRHVVDGNADPYTSYVVAKDPRSLVSTYDLAAAVDLMNDNADAALMGMFDSGVLAYDASGDGEGGKASNGAVKYTKAEAKTIFRGVEW